MERKSRKVLWPVKQAIKNKRYKVRESKKKKVGILKGNGIVKRIRVCLFNVFKLKQFSVF